MDERQIRLLSLEEVRQRMYGCQVPSADYQLLRRECQRRLEGWGKIANLTGCVIVLIVFFVLYAQWFLH